LHKPEITSPGRDMARLTASVAYTRATEPISAAIFVAWGQNREIHGAMDAYLFESEVGWLDRNYVYSRAELATKDILNAGPDRIGIVDFHALSRVGAFTLGYTRDVTGGARTRFGVGADITVYQVPANLKDSYGGPTSMHVFLRFRFMS
jgi:hypothetical protein